jgi:hypothetical protein
MQPPPAARQRAVTRRSPVGGTPSLLTCPSPAGGTRGRPAAGPGGTRGPGPVGGGDGSQGGRGRPQPIGTWGMSEISGKVGRGARFPSGSEAALCPIKKRRGVSASSLRRAALQGAAPARRPGNAAPGGGLQAAPCPPPSLHGPHAWAVVPARPQSSLPAGHGWGPSWGQTPPRGSRRSG